MVNPQRGEVELVIDGTRQVLRLSLGALAELEDRLEAESLVDLIQRFETGAFRSKDVMDLLICGLRGAGWTGGFGDLADAHIEGGLVTASETAARLLVLGFGDPADHSDGANV